MRRAITFVIAATGLVSGLTVAPAGAASGAVTLPSPLGFFQESCSSGSTNASLDRVTGPGTPPSGVGSLQMNSGSLSSISGLQYTINLPVADLQAWTFAHEESGSSSSLLAEIQIDRNGAGTVTDLLDKTVTETGGVWQSFDALAQTFVYSPSGGSASPTTWADYVVTHPNDVVKSVLFVMAGCSPSQISYVDNWSVKTSGTTHTYNFEPAPSLSSSASSSTITAASPVTLKTTLVGDSVPMAGQTVGLWAKSYPATTYRFLGNATTNSSGVASSVQRPEVQTSYQWRIDLPGFDAATSTVRTVKTRTKLTANVLDPTLRSGQSLVLWGATRTARSGDLVSLVRRTASGVRTLASTHTKSDGTYAFQRTLSKGSYTLFTKIGAGDGDLAGTSANVKVSAA